MKICSKLKPVTMHWIIYGLLFKRNICWCLIWNMNMQSASSIWSNLLSNVTVNIIEIVRNCVRGGEANVYGSSYYWNFRTSSFKQVACLILKDEVLITVGCPIFPSILIAKYLFTGSLKNRPIDNLETQKKYISMKNSKVFNYLLYAKSK
jgi:hypothetical protein